jgi:hypothetical protein
MADEQVNAPDQNLDADQNVVPLGAVPQSMGCKKHGCHCFTDSVQQRETSHVMYEGSVMGLLGLCRGTRRYE